MMFNNGNNQNQINTNTTFLSWYSGESKLVIGAWNEKLSLKFNAAVEKNADGLNIFDREREITTSLTLEKVVTLLKLIKDYLIPSSEDTNVMISTGTKDSPNAIIVGKKKEDENVVYYIIFLKGLNPDGKAGDGTKTVTYEFVNVDNMTKYDYTAGTGTVGVAPGQFLAFVTISENFVSALPIAYHGEKHSKNISSKYSQNNGGFNGPTRAPAADGGFGFSELEGLPFN